MDATIGFLDDLLLPDLSFLFDIWFFARVNIALRKVEESFEGTLVRLLTLVDQLLPLTHLQQLRNLHGIVIVVFALSLVITSEDTLASAHDNRGLHVVERNIAGQFHEHLLIHDCTISLSSLVLRINTVLSFFDFSVDKVFLVVVWVIILLIFLLIDESNGLLNLFSILGM